MNNSENKSPIRKLWLEQQAPEPVLAETPEQIASLPAGLRVRAVVCPECGAEVGHRCIGTRGERRALNHRARGDAFRAARAAGTLIPATRSIVVRTWEQPEIEVQAAPHPVPGTLEDAVTELRRLSAEFEAAKARVIELAVNAGR